MAKTYRKTYDHPLAQKYGLELRSQVDAWRIELTCWAEEIKTGYSSYHHLSEALRLMWPENVWHPWREWRFSDFCDPVNCIRDGKVVVRNFSWMGCGSGGKTFDAMMLVLAWWLASPSDSMVTMTSTTRDSARQRMWAVLQNLFWEFKELHGFSGPHAVNSSMILECEEGERRHAIYTQAVESGELTKAIANLQGRHARRMFLIVDEAMGTPEAIFTAIPNIFKGAQEVNLLFLSNAPLTKMNPFMKLACPSGGWNSVTPDDKKWKTRAIHEWQVPQGVCLHFNGKDSPNVVAKTTIYPFLYSWENWRRVEGNAEIAKTPQFWSQDLGFPPPEGALFTVLSESLIESKGATGKHIFNTYSRPIAGLDPSFGNDECKLVFGVYGDIDGGLTGIQITDSMVINIDVTAKDTDGRKIPVEYQIAHKVMEECQARGIKPDHIGIMAGGNPGVIGVLEREFGEIFRIQESGAASELPASVTDMRPSNEVYDRRVSELYFLVRSFVEGSQLKGLYEDAVQQLCSRLYSTEKSSRRMCIEKKDEFKARFGRSPDDAEAVIALCAVARQHGAEPQGIDVRAREVYDEDKQQESDLYDEDTRNNDPFDMFVT